MWGPQGARTSLGLRSTDRAPQHDGGGGQQGRHKKTHSVTCWRPSSLSGPPVHKVRHCSHPRWVGGRWRFALHVPRACIVFSVPLARARAHARQQSCSPAEAHRRVERDRLAAGGHGGRQALMVGGGLGSCRGPSTSAGRVETAAEGIGGDDRRQHGASWRRGPEEAVSIIGDEKQLGDEQDKSYTANRFGVDPPALPKGGSSWRARAWRVPH